MGEIDKLDNFEEFNTCVDEYTQVNIPVVTQQIEDYWDITRNLYVVNWALFAAMMITFIPLCMMPWYESIDACCAKNC